MSIFNDYTAATTNRDGKDIRCNSNQIYDRYLKKCIGCRDPTYKIRLEPVDPNSGRFITSNNAVINNAIGPGTYKCLNEPIKTFNESGKMLTFTCDTGERPGFIDRGSNTEKIFNEEGGIIPSEYDLKNNRKCIITFIGQGSGPGEYDIVRNKPMPMP
jgi:hypothetical protein